jgi:hypothetical protein
MQSRGQLIISLFSTEIRIDTDVAAVTESRPVFLCFATP